MASPDVLSIVDAQAMVEDTDNGLSGEQRKYLNSFADSMQKQDNAKSLNRTKNAIIKGADGYMHQVNHREIFLLVSHVSYVFYYTFHTYCSLNVVCSFICAYSKRWTTSSSC